ncbi:hypothetical protein JOC37_002546 [Desulfohalotomaculum tongense]|uniref:hypothetical protein n=1 Tax=Desulforadius tongensis TaxID=1216062 RepID=UPI001958D9AE|nr:hypothetical protein [Desulforadius tongensis]MBM7856116.1 hypothetical protein [Desulforadius tongensis]
MDRIGRLNRFYYVLNLLENKIGKHTLANCDGKMNWPRQGIYFFFEEGEVRETNGEPRVVRVGTHAVSSGSKTTLWNRLRTHKGSVSGKYSGGGNHRGSIFRLHIGTAIINKHNIELNTWGKGSSAKSSTRKAEHSLEVAVSKKIRSMPFLWVKAEDDAGPQSIRKFIERNAIALLSNYQRPVIDGPSGNWLGLYCQNKFVRHSGLWNVDHVAEQYDPYFLEIFYQLVKDM